MKITHLLFVVAVLLSLTSGVRAEEETKGALLVIPELRSKDQSFQGAKWEQGASLENFLVLNSTSGPKERTRLYLSYDKTHFYVSGEAASFALDSVSNMADGFSAKAVDRDGKVTADDSVEIRVQNPIGGSYSIAINALGTIQDMQYDSHQDKSWNGDISVQTETGEGNWRFQMAISLASLGIPEPTEGEVISFNGIRRDSLSGEVSVADPDMMKLVFGGSSAFVQVSNFEQPLSSGSKIPLTVVNGKGQTLAWKREILQNQSVVTSSGASLIATSERSEMETTSSPEKAPLARRERISVYATGHLIYRSPDFPFQDNRSEVRISAKAEGPFTLSWNGKELASGKESLKDAPAGLVYGTNELTIRMASDHSPEVTIVGPGGEPLAAGKTWEKVSSSENETVFRKTIAYHATVLLPHFPDGIAELAAGSAQFFHWDGGDLKEWPVETELPDFRLIVEVPEGLHFLGASGYLPPESAATEAGLASLPKVAEYTWSKQGEVKHGEVTYERYVISRNLPVLLTSKKETWLQEVARRQQGMVFAVRSDPSKESGTFPPMYYGMEANGETVVEVPNLMIFEARAALNGETPKEIILSLYTRLGLIRDPKLLETFFDTVKSAGINEIFGETASTYPRQIGLRQSSFFALSQSSRVGFGMGTVMVDKILEAYPEAQAVTFGGEKRLTPCLAWLSGHEEAWPVIEKEIADIARRNPSMSQLFWDYEFPPFPEGVDAYPMFSEFGIAAFQKTYDIKGKLTPEMIREKYADEWVAFTCGEIARVVDRLQQAAAKQGMGFTMYSGYQLPYTQRRYNVDWKKLGPYLDRAYCGYSSDPKLIEGTRDALGKTQLVGALLAQGPSAPSRSAATIVRTMLSHRGGVLFWFEGGGASAKTLAPIAQASRFASAYESFILDGDRVEDFSGIPDSDRDGVVVLRRKNEILLVFLNEGDSSRQFHVELPEGMFVGPAGSGPSTTEGRTLSQTVEAGGVGSLLLQRNNEAK